VTSVGVSVQNLALSSPSSLVTGALQAFQPLIVQAISQAVSSALQGEVQSVLDASVLAGITQPLALPVPTLAGSAPLGFELGADRAQGGPAGLAVALGFEVVALAPLATRATPQLLVTGSQPPLNVVPGSDFAGLFSTDALDALLEAYWLAGGTSYTLDGSTQPSPLLTARALYPFLPQVTQLAPDGDTPMVIEVSSASPPLATLPGGGSPVTLTVGEAQVRVLLDYEDGLPPLELFTLRVPCEVSAQVAIQGGAVLIQDLNAPVVSVDVLSEPATPLDDLAIQDFLVQLFPFVLQQYAGQIPPIAIPALPPGFRLSNAGLALGTGYVEVWGDF